MASSALADALVLVSTTYELGFFDNEEKEDLKTLLEALAAIEISSPDDFRLTFVTDSKVEKGAIERFTSGELSRFRALLTQFAEDLVPEVGLLVPVEDEPLLKKSRPCHNVGGRLVYKTFEDYGSLPAASGKGPSKYALSKASIKHREQAVRSISKMEQRLAAGASDDLSGQGPPSTNLHQRDEGLRRKAVDLGYAVLQEVGSASPRFSEIFPEGNLTQDKGMRDAFDDIILHGVDPKVVISQAAEVWRFLHWLQALGVEMSDVSELRVAGFIRNAAGRGKSVPGRVRSSLMWFQGVTNIILGADKVEIKRMVRSTVGSVGLASDPESAKMIPIGIVESLERGIFTARTGVLKVFCGLGCLLTFGIKRWSDAQHISSMELAGDSLVVKSWKSKKKKSSISWGALRVGFTNRTGWAEEFLKILNEFGFPGEDFLITAPRTDLLGFTKTPARWGDAERGIHAALIEVGVDVDEAISYSLHSFRHLLVTCARQLGMPEPSIDVMAGWKVKASSGMPSVYDSVAVSAELLHKKAVHDNIRRGWQLVPSGEIPQRPVVPLTGSAGPSTPSPKKAISFTPPRAKLQRGADLQLERMRTCPLNSTVKQVLNVPVGLVHLVVENPLVDIKCPATVCNLWRCGSSKAPVKSAKFAQTSSDWTGENCKYGFCERCFGDNYPTERVIGGKADASPGQEVSDSDSSSSESESS